MDKPSGQAGYNVFLARNKKEFERCLLETPEERPDVFWNGDRGVEQRISHVEDLYLKGYNQALQDFGMKGKGKGFRAPPYWVYSVPAGGHVKGAPMQQVPGALQELLEDKGKGKGKWK